jgi:predicted TIM-barrel fold metal-dependent hydrolase
VNDADVPAVWRSLGLPGLVDVHVHFLPEPVLRKVWAVFDDAETRYGVPWPVAYRWDEPARVAHLQALGVRAYPALVYAHRPAMAEWLSRWAVDFGRRTPGCLPTATFYPEPGVTGYVRWALEAGARVFKVHVQVGDFDPREPVLDPVWGMLADAGVPVVTHCGSGPLPGTYTGPANVEAVLRRHPELRMVIAHMGMPEYAEHLALAQRYRNVYLDTTMAFTDFVTGLAPYPPDLLPKLSDLGGRILLGTDFPNIPYPYAHQVEALLRLDLGEPWLRGVLHDNAARLLGLGAADDRVG